MDFVLAYQMPLFVDGTQAPVCSAQMLDIRPYIIHPSVFTRQADSLSGRLLVRPTPCQAGSLSGRLLARPNQCMPLTALLTGAFQHASKQSATPASRTPWPPSARLYFLRSLSSTKFICFFSSTVFRFATQTASPPEVPAPNSKEGAAAAAAAAETQAPEPPPPAADPAPPQTKQGNGLGKLFFSMAGKLPHWFFLVRRSLGSSHCCLRTACEECSRAVKS